MNQKKETKNPHTYLEIPRLYSYIFQLEFAMASAPKEILYVGKGTGIAPYLLSWCSGHPRVVTLDIEEEMKPDVVGSVLDIPLPDNAYEITMCCQVLEHLPFDRFLPALKELYRVTQKQLILSLPDKRLFFGFRIKVPLFQWGCQLNLSRKFLLPDIEEKKKKSGHHWEIGYPGAEFRRVKQAIREAGWQIRKCRRVDDLSWHTFFALEKKGFK